MVNQRLDQRHSWELGDTGALGLGWGVSDGHLFVAMGLLGVARWSVTGVGCAVAGRDR